MQIMQRFITNPEIMCIPMPSKFQEGFKHPTFQRKKIYKCIVHIISKIQRLNVKIKAQKRMELKKYRISIILLPLLDHKLEILCTQLEEDQGMHRVFPTR